MRSANNFASKYGDPRLSSRRRFPTGYLRYCTLASISLIYSRSHPTSSPSVFKRNVLLKKIIPVVLIMVIYNLLITTNNETFLLLLGFDPITIYIQV
jgi:hypothetical protein